MSESTFIRGRGRRRSKKSSGHAYRPGRLITQPQERAELLEVLNNQQKVGLLTNTFS